MVDGSFGTVTSGENSPVTPASTLRNNIEGYSSSTTSETVNAWSDTQSSKFNINDATAEGRSKYVTDTLTKMLSTNDRINEYISYTNKVFAMPYHFSDMADYRPYKDVQYGRTFLKNIVAEAPIIQLVPGLASYMPGINKTERSYIENYISATNLGTNMATAVTDRVLGTQARYYDFVPAYAQYIRYVNLLCRASAVYMGIGDSIVPGTDNEKYKNYDWGKWSYSNFKGLGTVGADWDNDISLTAIFSQIKEAVSSIFANTDDWLNDYKYLRFYGTDVDFGESMSNSSTESQFASLFENVKPLVREAQFLGGGKNGILKGLLGTVGETVTFAGDLVESIMGGEVDGGLSSIIGNTAHILTGSNVVFPELWADSSFNKDYSFSVNLVSPYGDTESIFLNIMVPMMHLIAMSYPKQTSANSYASPFLVKAFSRGWFSTDIAMITNIAIKKGGDGTAWTPSGLPTEVKIEISLKDLYQSLSIPPTTSPMMFFRNTSLMEYLAVNAGVDISSTQLATKIQTIFDTLGNTLFDIPTNIANNIRDALGNFILPYLKIGAF